MKYIKLFENYSTHDIIGAKVGDVVICMSSIAVIEEGKRYEILEILEILDHENEHKKDIIVKNSEDLLTVKDAETNEVFWSSENDQKMRHFYAWRFIPEHIHDAKRYNL